MARSRSQTTDARVQQRSATIEHLRSRGALDIPESLPIAEHHDDLLAMIRDHQVVIVAGETGSGKSTQLPKLCLELGRGANGLIGHTQPRRVAARTIAERLAEEMGVELGDAVGYTVRFTDRVGDGTLVKVMTDGILLAEIQRDRMLRRYDTIIVDEAHERSLNVDFLLGYLHGLLRRRPDLHLIVTSATIDTERFAAHFAGPDGPAPVVQVSGRTYPVEMRYRPIGEQPDDDRDQVQAVCDAVDELSDAGPGDVLVFLSGEREIHDVADTLRRRSADSRSRSKQVEVLPLYARLSAAEQHRIFQPHPGRRVVLATNVAETSITVPGVRYVVDAGSARISRYSHRLKVQRLPIEAVSQASANQRAGRCGRVAAGICIRLYAEDDYAARPEFTEPEILRTNLASVILQMTALGLGDVASFPFLDPPDNRSVRDGYALLEELGAIQPEVDGAARRLTALGTRLARLPVDPRLGRMVLEAERLNCVREVLVIASALSIQDPRERPAESQQAADESHRRFATDGSDFLAFVRLWDHLRERQSELGSSQFRKMCRAEFLNYLRVREWQDLYSQLRQIVGTLGIHLAAHTHEPAALAHPDNVHQALMAGLLSHLGAREGTTRDYKGAHGSTFAIARGSSVAKHLPRWIMAAELVETNRLWARTATSIQPEWAERIGSHLVRRSYSEPRWDAKRGRAVTTERVTLYGLPIVAGRTVGLDRTDPVLARWMFIRHALVEGDWTTHHQFVAHNRDVVDQLRALEERTRRSGLVDDDAVHAFYDARLGDDVVSTRHFDQWWKQQRRAEPDLLTMTREILLGTGPGDDIDAFPELWYQNDLVVELSYRFEPGTADDGVTVHIPLAVLNRITADGFDWQVPGLRDELVAALIRTLPKDYRREMVPLNDIISATVQRLPAPSGRLMDALAATLTEVSRVIVPPELFDPQRVPLHLRVTFDVLDADGLSLGRDKDLDALRRRLNPQLRAAIAAASLLAERTGITTWDLGTLPQVVDNLHDGHLVRGFPALVDEGDSVSLRILTNADLQARVMRTGVRRLLMLTVPAARRSVEAGLTNAHRLAIAGGSVGSLDELVIDCITASADRIVRDVELPWDADAFAALVRVARNEMATRASSALRTAATAAGAARDIEARLAKLVAPAVQASADDVRAQLRRLVRPGFVTATGLDRMDDVLRYLRGLDRRLDKLPDDPLRDQSKMRQINALERQYVVLLDRLGRGGVNADVIELGWMLEELRISEFAQVVGTKRPVSPQRIVTELARLAS
ncbi:MAG: ATP-dependent helicase HrpA [Ilumatobacteraceae bacterium]|nr:ATP-dependent helicase HrpA [Ilumatobacteraceae bacterium]